MDQDVDSSRTLLYGVASILIQAFLLAVVYFKFMYDSEFIPMPQFRMKHVYNTFIVVLILFIMFYDRPANTISRIWKLIQKFVDSTEKSLAGQPTPNTTEAPPT